MSTRGSGPGSSVASVAPQAFCPCGSTHPRPVRAGPPLCDRRRRIGGGHARQGHAPHAAADRRSCRVRSIAHMRADLLGARADRRPLRRHASRRHGGLSRVCQLRARNCAVPASTHVISAFLRSTGRPSSAERRLLRSGALIEALEYSPSTPPGGLRARLVPSGDGEANDFDGVGGAIALIRRGTCYFTVKARTQLQPARPRLSSSTRSKGRSTERSAVHAARIPVAAIAGALGSELAESQNIFELELVARNVGSSSRTSSPMYDWELVVLVVGAHSTRSSQGPASTTTRLARRPCSRWRRSAPASRSRRPLRLLGSGEAGLFSGSRAYVSTALKSEIVGYLQPDALGRGSGEYGIYQGASAARWLAFRAPRSRRSPDRHRRTLDHAPFAQAGVPIGGLFAGDYACYHRPCDRVSAIDFAVLETLALGRPPAVASFAPSDR